MLLKRIYLTSLLVGVVGLLILSIMTMSAIKNSNDPFGNFFQYFAMILFLTLLICGIVIYARERKARYLLLSSLMPLVFLDFYYFYIHKLLQEINTPVMLMKSTDNTGLWIGLSITVIALFIPIFTYYLMRNYYLKKKSAGVD